MMGGIIRQKILYFLPKLLYNLTSVVSLKT